MDDIKSYGIDVEDQLLSALSEELAKNIDREILRGLGIEPDKNKRRMNKIGRIIEKNEKSSTT